MTCRPTRVCSRSATLASGRPACVCNFDDQRDHTRPELCAGRSQRVGGLQGVAALDPPPTLRAVADLRCRSDAPAGAPGEGLPDTVPPHRSLRPRRRSPDRWCRGLAGPSVRSAILIRSARRASGAAWVGPGSPSMVWGFFRSGQGGGCCSAAPRFSAVSPPSTSPRSPVTSFRVRASCGRNCLAAVHVFNVGLFHDGFRAAVGEGRHHHGLGPSDLDWLEIDRQSSTRGRARNPRRRSRGALYGWWPADISDDAALPELLGLNRGC